MAFVGDGPQLGSDGVQLFGGPGPAERELQAFGEGGERFAVRRVGVAALDVQSACSSPTTWVPDITGTAT